MNNKLSSSIIVVGALTLGLVASANDPDLCRDLAKFACAPGSYNDGTGISQNTSNFLDEPALKKIKSTIKKRLEKAFKQNLENDQAYRALALKAFGLTESPYCQPDAKGGQKVCTSLATEALTEEILPYISSLNSKTLDDLTYKQDDPLKGPIVDLDAVLVNPTTRKIALNVSQETRKELADPKLDEKIKGKVDEIKDLLIERVRFAIKDEQVRDRTIEKIRGIEFKGTDCTELPPRSSSLPKRSLQNPEISVAGYIIPNAYYNPGDNSFRYCNGFKFLTNSDFSNVHFIAHELAHSIDPCNINSEVEIKGKKVVAKAYSNPSDLPQDEKEFPLPDVVGCLRDSASVNASHGLSGRPRPLVIESKIPVSGNAFCSNDQITEAFADLMGFDVLSEYIENHWNGLSVEQKRVGYSNTFRGACNYMEYINGANNRQGAIDVHSSSPDRINSILLANPAIRSQMNCFQPSTHKDCSQFISAHSLSKTKVQDPAETVK